MVLLSVMLSVIRFCVQPATPRGSWWSLCFYRLVGCPLALLLCDRSITSLKSCHNSLIFPFIVSSVGDCRGLKVSVRFFTSLREITGKKEETLEFSNDKKVTVDEVLCLLSREHGRRFVDYVYDSKTGEVKGFLQFLINGKSASTLNGLRTELKHGDVLAIIPPVGGG